MEGFLVFFTSEAEEDVLEAHAWYKQHSAELSKVFRNVWILK